MPSDRNESVFRLFSSTPESVAKQYAWLTGSFPSPLPSPLILIQAFLISPIIPFYFAPFANSKKIKNQKDREYRMET